VGTLGFWGVIGVILLGHLVTIPTALAISEIATNKRVEGGGEYFIISRSFGLNIGATIGFALFISQAISVAFYIIAFTEAFESLFNWFNARFDFNLPRQVHERSCHDRTSYPDSQEGGFCGHEDTLRCGGHFDNVAGFCFSWEAPNIRRSHALQPLLQLAKRRQGDSFLWSLPSSFPRLLA
jgi:amino acid transporter